MVLALNISIEKEGSIVDVYDKVFSLDGGIYDRCINNKNFADKHRIVEVKEQIHQISRDIAIWMFENKSEDAYIPKKEYQIICANVMQAPEWKNDDAQPDFLIGNYFKLVKHCEGIDSEELYFVHRSIYEYFVAETIYNSIENAMIKLTEESQEELAGKIVIYIKQGLITHTIGEYLQYKLLRLCNSFNNRKRDYFFQWWEEAVKKLMSNGMFYYTGGNIQEYRSIIDKELMCFLNLIKILRLLMGTSTKEYIFESVDKEQLEKYIRFRLVACRIEEQRYGVEKFNLGQISLVGINLSGADLRYANLQGTNLQGANLCETNLSAKNLRGTKLQGANLQGANLQGADLRTAGIRGIKLEEANLRDTIFDEKQVAYLRDYCNLDDSKVYMLSENKVISFESYCKRTKD